MAAVTQGTANFPLDQRGFTLIELAVVMFIVALLLGGMLMPLTAQQDILAQRNTEKALTDAKEILLGFAVLNERLPCPATVNSSGRETFCSTQTYPCTGTEDYAYSSGTNNGVCFDYYGGYLPAVTLGIQPTDGNGFAVDYWGRNPSNRIRYSVSTNALNTAATPTSYVLTRSQGMKSAIVKPDLSVCSSGAQVLYPGTLMAGTNNYARCNTGASLVDDAVAVMYSLGKNSGIGGAAVDESHNPNPLTPVVADPAFVNALQGPGFDDSVVWIGPSLLIGRLVAAGKL